MRIKNFGALCAAFSAAVSITSAGVAAAEPIPAGVHYSAKTVGKTVVVRTDGVLAKRDNLLQVMDKSGRMVATLPLAYQMGDKVWPIDARIAGANVTLTPRTDAAAARPASRPQPARHEVDAMANLPEAAHGAFGALGLATAVGGLTGTIVGAGLGCVAGAVLGLPFAILPGAAGGCLAGMLVGGGVGAMIGTIAVGGPALPIVLFQFFNALNAPTSPGHGAK